VIDAHAHLDACAEPADVLLSRARATGVRGVVTIGAGLDSCRAALEIAGAQPDVAAALGVDPHNAREADAERVDELRELLSHPRAVAVGETGLDYHYGPDAKLEQRTLFEAQLALADEIGLPVVIHCREAAADTAALLRGFAGTVILHCFSEPELEVDAAEHGWYVSFAGNVTYPRSEDLRGVAERVDGNRLLVETDAPYLSPQPRRGRPNEPANVVHTVATLAAVRGEAPSEVGERTARNAVAAFGLP
jgi:TatD DNase family protein